MLSIVISSPVTAWYVSRSLCVSVCFYLCPFLSSAYVILSVCALKFPNISSLLHIIFVRFVTNNFNVIFRDLYRYRIEHFLKKVERHICMLQWISLSLHFQYLYQVHFEGNWTCREEVQIDHNGVVKLCDFGLARVMDKDPSSGSENSRAGTPVYLAPEALQGAPTTNKIDIYRSFFYKTDL